MRAHRLQANGAPAPRRQRPELRAMGVTSALPRNRPRPQACSPRPLRRSACTKARRDRPGIHPIRLASRMAEAQGYLVPARAGASLRWRTGVRSIQAALRPRSQGTGRNAAAPRAGRVHRRPRSAASRPPARLQTARHRSCTGRGESSTAARPSQGSCAIRVRHAGCRLAGRKRRLCTPAPGRTRPPHGWRPFRRREFPPFRAA